MSNTTNQDKGNPAVNEQTPLWFQKYSWFAKAIMGTVSTFLVALLTALIPYMENGWHIPPIGWVTAIVAGLVAGGATGGAVYITPNTIKIK
jgi:hypothetical protein